MKVYSKEKIQEFLSENLEGRPGSLVHDFHEGNNIDIEALREYCRLAKDVNLQLEKGDVNCAIFAKICFIHSAIWKYIACHFDPNDGYKIKNFSSDLYGEMVDELDSIFDVRLLRRI